MSHQVTTPTAAKAELSPATRAEIDAWIAEQAVETPRDA